MSLHARVRLSGRDVRTKRSRPAHDFAIELVRQLVVPTFVIDAAGFVIVWNEACERLTGMAASVVIGTREHWRAFYDRQRPCLADLVLDGRAGDIDRHYAPGAGIAGRSGAAHAENWCHMPLHGQQRYLAVDAGPIRDADGKIIASARRCATSPISSSTSSGSKAWPTSTR